MSRTTGLFAIGALLLALAARTLVPVAEEDPSEGFWAPARQVDVDAPTTTWERPAEIRDPFVPLILPDPPEALPEDLEEE